MATGKSTKATGAASKRQNQPNQRRVVYIRRRPQPKKTGFRRLVEIVGVRAVSLILLGLVGGVASGLLYLVRIQAQNQALFALVDRMIAK